ncbi:MAG TPA: hypothetical protein VK211_11965 [Kamptonema sp.]|nr:hypothetical protein [Kamptonema sp.]
MKVRGKAVLRRRSQPQASLPDDFGFVWWVGGDRPVVDLMGVEKYSTYNLDCNNLLTFSRLQFLEYMNFC